MSLSQYFALEELLDENENRKTIFGNYKHYVEIHPRSPYKSYDEVLQEYNDIGDRENYRSNYKNAILKVLGDVDCDILLLPEYTIPFNIYNQIEKTISQISGNRECVIVAGSHIDENGFNVCPIFIPDVEGKKTCQIYHLYKNNFSPFEKELRLMKNRGTAHLKFLNTIWGNLYIQTCYDAYTVSSQGFENIDILLVPSFNPSLEFKEVIKQKASQYKLVAGYANTINEKGLETEFFYPPQQALTGSLRGVRSLHYRGPEGEHVTEVPIFFEGETKKKLIEGFNFRIKQLDFNIIQLDIRRGIPSRVEATDR